MENHLTHHIARETLLEFERAGTAIEYVVVGSDDGLVLQAKIGGDVRILQTSLGKTRFFRNLDAVARTLAWLGVKKAQLDLGPWQPKSTARP